ncbi:hypothetical protein CTAYLR_004752 [Chrysophaeum taylorii]|uniref:Glutamyl/glutaminyl-tRNA synthetase class Ib catalytic domain-containing protein n=1 Tax=Chrysophaeum taylorii TaxID=2483200 RepID=A0AAD7U9P0_9STRA|nr:hypothetical protein CTAYLR_004752 [Chrysophaeum taylorii]
MKLRARFAPSPTGALHLGGARTALFNHLLVRGAALRGDDAALVLRIDDTDAQRGSKEAEAAIVRDLRWLGVSWADGVARASHRSHIYARAAADLVDRGVAYPDFSAEPRGWQRWRRADPAEVRTRLRAGEPHALRFRVPRGARRTIRVVDAVRGPLVWADVARALPEDVVLARRDGSPLYNFCTAVDDNLMEITHVIRGDEHVPNTLCQVLLLEALGRRELPTYAHCALVVDAHRKKLSKRDTHRPAGAPYAGLTVEAARRDGITPLGLATYLASLGFSPPAGHGQQPREVFDDLDDLARVFDLSRVSPAPAAYDPAKLRWIDARCLRLLSTAGRRELVREQLERCFAEVIPPTFVDFCAFELFGDDSMTAFDISQGAREAVTFDLGALLLESDENIAAVRRVVEVILAAELPVLDGTQQSVDAFHAWIDAALETTQLHRRRTFMPILRLALTTSSRGPDLATQLRLINLAVAEGVPGVVPIPRRVDILQSALK